MNEEFFGYQDERGDENDTSRSDAHSASVVDLLSVEDREVITVSEYFDESLYCIFVHTKSACW